LLLFNLKSHSSLNGTQTARLWRGYSPTFSFRSFFFLLAVMDLFHLLRSVALL
jgi:hypothetical protein